MPVAIRGDVSADRIIDIGDVVYLTNCQYKYSFAPHPLWTGDANCDENVNVGDVICLINYLFKGDSAPSC